MSTTATHAHSTPTRPSLALLTAVEVRKSTDTRAGRWFLAVLALLVAAVLAYQLGIGAGEPITFERFHGGAMSVVRLVLPVLGVLLMTGEWTQRTAMTTFALTPRRGRVLAAKIGAAVAVAVSVALLVAAAAAAATALAAAGGDPVNWASAPRLVVGSAAATVLAVLMGVGLGALIQHTAAAVVVYFVAPVLVGVTADEVLGDGARWVAVLEALSRVDRLDPTGPVAPAVAALALWIALPLALGVMRAVRREVS